MRLNRNIILIILIFLLYSSPSFASSGDTGTTAGAFLKLNGGTRAAAMGDTFVAIADDPSAIYWNPAGLTQIKSLELSSMYANWLAGTNYTTLSLVRPFNPSIIGGISINYLSMGEIEETTLSQPGGTGRKFTPTDYVVTLCFARKINPRLSLGVNVKSLNESIDSSDASGYAADLGLLLALSEKSRFGFAVKNMGSLSGANNSLPLNYRAGLSLKMLPNDALLLGVDFNMPNDNQSTLHFGAEYALRNTLFMRIGYNNRKETNAGGTYGMGAGIKWKNLKLDYAYVPFGDLGNTSRISFNLSF